MQERVLIFNTGAPDAAQKEGELNALLASGYRILEQREMAPGTVWLRLSSQDPAPAVPPAASALSGATAPSYTGAAEDMLPERRGRTLAIVLAISLLKVLCVAVTLRDVDDNDVMMPFVAEAIVVLAAVVAWRSLSRAGIIGSASVHTGMNAGQERTLWRSLLGVVLLQMGVYVAAMIESSDLDEPATMLLMALVGAGVFQGLKTWAVLRRLPATGNT